jgi:decaprenylphospho-beta-D-erythro-pentofuranosid-2-ulose 2-reductase
VFGFLEAAFNVTVQSARVHGVKKVIILGALSAIAEHAARTWAIEGAHIILAGRQPERLKQVAGNLRVRGGVAQTWVADLAAVDAGKSLCEMVATLQSVDIVLLAYGILGDQSKPEPDAATAQQVLVTNFISAAAWCLSAADILEHQGHGTLIVIGSVAGDRGRASNYIYGASKAGLGILVQGIAHRLARSGARAVLVKAGFVDTPMTAAVPHKGLLWSKPDAVARVIVAAAENTSTRPIVYAPWFWQWIMYVVRLLPARIMHKTNL